MCNLYRLSKGPAEIAKLFADRQARRRLLATELPSPPMPYSRDGICRSRGRAGRDDANLVCLAR